MQHRSRIKTSVKASPGSTLRLTMALALALNGGLLAGCGSSGGGLVGSSSKTPSKAVKSHVHLLQTQSLHALAQSGVANSTMSAMSGNGAGNSAASGVSLASASGGSTGGASMNAAPVVPLTGQFIRNIAATNHAMRAVALRRMRARHTAHLGRGRDSTAGSPPVSDPLVPDPGPPLTFYYDDYLGLWVDTLDTPTASTYTLYEDEAKTKPAGSLTSTFPVDSVYPQVYTSNYTYTAGTLAGSHGTYTNTYNQDHSGSSVYQDVNADGSGDQGSSTQTSTGDYTWKGRADNADKSYTTFSGTFHADGSGNTRTAGSDGYVYDVTYRADGSGHGRITGPDAGLPATIDWDAQGNTTIVYADGSSEFSPGWGYGGGLYADGGVESETTTSSTTVNATTTMDAPPTPPRVSKQVHKTAH